MTLLVAVKANLRRAIWSIRTLLGKVAELLSLVRNGHFISHDEKDTNLALAALGFGISHSWFFTLVSPMTLLATVPAGVRVIIGLAVLRAVAETMIKRITVSALHNNPLKFIGNLAHLTVFPEMTLLLAGMAELTIVILKGTGEFKTRQVLFSSRGHAGSSGLHTTRSSRLVQGPDVDELFTQLAIGANDNLIIRDFVE